MILSNVLYKVPNKLTVAPKALFWFDHIVLLHFLINLWR